MKNLFGFIAVAIVISAVAAVVAYAQYNPAKELDPLVAAPHLYKTEFENEYVRVIRMNIKSPSSDWPIHSHEGRVIVLLTPCKGAEVLESGDRTEFDLDVGEILWSPPETHGGASLVVESDCSLIEVEVKAVIQ